MMNLIYSASTKEEQYCQDCEVDLSPLVQQYLTNGYDYVDFSDFHIENGTAYFDEELYNAKADRIQEEKAYKNAKIRLVKLSEDIVQDTAGVKIAKIVDIKLEFLELLNVARAYESKLPKESNDAKN